MNVWDSTWRLALPLFGRR